MPTYRTVEGDVEKLMIGVMKKYHGDLMDAGVTVGLLYAHAKRDKNDEPKGPALKWAGSAAAAVVKINSLKDRVQGEPDATVVIDGDRWPEWSEKRRVALLDHEIFHLELQRDDEGAIKLDDASRPKLRLRPHDLQLGTFDIISERHREHAIDTEMLATASKKFVQMQIPWG